jgi:monothiol glutaredoxin
MPLTDPQREKLAELVRSNPVVLFMKGNRRFPACGFSATVIGILDQLTSGYQTVNILEDGAVREGMKEFSSWPTFPQLYVKGEFVGGCDIVKELFASGELQKVLSGAGLEPKALKTPKVTISASAVAAFKEAAADAGDEVLRLEIDADFNCDLHFGPRAADDVEVKTPGIAIHIARGSVARADGVSIDFIDGPKGAAFKIDNPNEPPRVKRIGPRELRAMLDAGRVELFDVRPDEERALAAITAAKKLDAKTQEHILSLPKDTPIAFHCHHGGRSRAAADALLREGFTTVYNLEGGIEAWSNEVDPTVPHY